MPAKVDADARRRELTVASAELIAEEGIGALTNQRLAERLSASTTVVTHYFGSKRELVLEVYETMASRSRARLEHAIDTHPDDPLTACVRALLPVDDETRVEWRVWLVYQGMSVGDADLTAIWARRLGTGVALLRTLLAADRRAGRLRPGFDPTAEAHRLFAFVQGISFQSIVDPATWTTRRLRAEVDAELARVRSG